MTITSASANIISMQFRMQSASQGHPQSQAVEGWLSTHTCSIAQLCAFTASMADATTSNCGNMCTVLCVYNHQYFSITFASQQHNALLSSPPPTLLRRRLSFSCLNLLAQFTHQHQHQQSPPKVSQIHKHKKKQIMLLLQFHYYNTPNYNQQHNALHSSPPLSYANYDDVFFFSLAQHNTTHN